MGARSRSTERIAKKPHLCPYHELAILDQHTPLPEQPEQPDDASALPAPPSMAEHMPERSAPDEKSARKGPRRRFGEQSAPNSRRVMPNLEIISSGSPRRLIESWLGAMCKSMASDLILRADGRPSLRVDGRISFLDGRVPGPGPMEEVLLTILGEDRMKIWRSTGSADSALELDGLGRFRINAYKQMGEPALVIRRINETAPELETLGLPTEEMKQLAGRKRGLILVTGIAGSGKSTTLAGIIQHMNRNYERHIITLEDPVELMYTEDQCVISQREVGTDTTDFGEGLRHALRQSPDVILIGEMRDAETVIAALEATETGHTVLSTMHTVNAAQTVDRILGFFPGERHIQVRQRMADNLAGVLSQRLVPAIAGGQVPAYELMMSTPQVRELIEGGHTGEMARAIETGGEAGLISFNECLRQMIERQAIQLEDGLATSDRPEELLLALRGIRSSSDRFSAPEVGPGTNPGAGPPPEEGDGLRMAR